MVMEEMFVAVMILKKNFIIIIWPSKRKEVGGGVPFGSCCKDFFLFARWDRGESRVMKEKN